HEIAAAVIDLRVVAAENERRVPVEAVRRLSGQSPNHCRHLLAGQRQRVSDVRQGAGDRRLDSGLFLAARTDTRELSGPQVSPGHAPILNLEIDQVRVVGIDAADEAVAAADADPIFVDRAAAAEAVTRPAPGA